jgi:Na+/proline symporter
MLDFISSSLNRDIVKKYFDENFSDKELKDF